MKITFDYNQNNEIKDRTGEKVAGSAMSHVNGSYHRKVQGSAASGILFGSSTDDKAYGKVGKTAQDIKEQAGLLSGEDYKNYMAVMSSTMSEEDFSALIEDGVKPGKVEVSDMVTIMDHIKAVMAQSGVVVSGFNGSGDIPLEKLEAMAGDKAYAQSIARVFSENQIPLTEENAENAIKQTNYALEINGLSDHMKQLLLENGSELSIDEMYKASFSGEKKNGFSGFSQAKGSSYFADDLNGYYGKTPETPDLEALSSQIEKVIKEAGVGISEETKAEAAWILERGILLTSENLEKLHEMNQMTFPMNRDEILTHVAEAIREGKQPQDANLAKDGIYRQSEKLLETVNGISDEAVEAVVSFGETLNIRNLSRAQREIQLTVDYREKPAVSEETLLHAKRTLEEVRLQMTISANILLLKSDYAIDTAELSQLVEQLKQVESEQETTYGLSLPDEQKNSLFRETMDKTRAIRQMPAALIPDVISRSKDFTLNQVYEQGKIWESTYKRAGETYEALMTAPRADLGDRLKDAFSNIDKLLMDMDMELSEDNRRAVRILAYNRMEITEENLVNVREADETLNHLLKKMTPAATLQMIREEINPLEESVQALTEYFEEQENDFTEQAESFSKFLYKLEKGNQISPEERDSYLGIYRLIRQIEKGDGKAIGTLVANGQELSFANLLSAVRTSQKKGVNTVIDDNFGLLSDTEVKGKRISDQINHYYEMKAGELLSRMDPQLMAESMVTMDTTWEELDQIYRQREEELQQHSDLERAYRSEQLNQLRGDVQPESDAAEYLLANGQPVTPDYLHAAKKLMKERGELFRRIKDVLSENSHEEEALLLELDKISENFTDGEHAQKAYEEVKNIVSERLEEKMLSGEMGYLDIRALSSLSKQLSLAGNLAKEENYEIPVVIDGQLTSANVRFRHDRSQTEDGSGNVAIQISLTGGEKIFASFQVQGESITGYMGCNDERILKKLQEKQEDFTEKILSETGKMADISYVYSEDMKISYSRNIDQAEEVQGRHTSAKNLYLAAKTFMGLLEEISQ